MLPNAALKPVYDRLVWVWVYRDFKNSPTDRAAERVSIRFGVTAWPMHFLVHPETLAELADTGREVKSFLEAVERAKVRVRGGIEVTQQLERAEARACELEERPTLEAARAGLEDADLVVRTRALRVVAEKDPGSVAAHAVDLLATPNDAFRFEVCALLAKHGDARAKPPLEALLAKPTGSRNPNRLRCEAAAALGACGDAGSLAALAPPATSGDIYNGLTRVSIDAVAAIARREPRSLKEAVAILRAAYPPPPTAQQLAVPNGRAQQFCEQLARHVHEVLTQLTEKTVPFPSPYDAAGRERLAKSW